MSLARGGRRDIDGGRAVSGSSAAGPSGFDRVARRRSSRSFIVSTVVPNRPGANQVALDRGQGTPCRQDRRTAVNGLNGANSARTVGLASRDAHDLSGTIDQKAAGKCVRASSLTTRG